MPNIKMSSDYIHNGFTTVENVFISEFMPSLSFEATKVYLYSIYICNSPVNKSATDTLISALDIDQNQLTRAVDELKSYNLVRLLSAKPLEYELIPISNNVASMKKYKPEKYADFTVQLQQLFQDRTFMPNDYLKYIELIEDYKFAPEALIMIVGYCVRIKTTKVHTNYIVAVAKAWAEEGATTIDAVENKLKEMESNTDDMRQIFFTLNLKSAPDLADKQLYIKWTKSWGYTFDAVIETAKLCKKRGGMVKLDGMLDQFYRLNIFTLKEIEEHAKYIESTRKLAFDVNKKLGLYYDNVDNIIETYITDWLNKGYDDKAIVALAGYCFAHNVRALDGMASVIDRFYKQGLITLEAINQHIDGAIAKDKEIKHLLELCGSLRIVRENDRVCYNIWTNTWGVASDIIEYSATLAIGKAQPFAYMNQLLASWQNSGLKTLNECKSSQTAFKTIGSSSARFEGERNYSKEELDSIFGDRSDPSRLDDIEF